jgi:NarL family two-component system sensor histidine kinase YdfH
MPQHLDLWSFTAFTVLLLIYVLLLWRALEGSFRQHRLWFVFLLQAGTIFVIGIIVQQQSVALSLYLTLILAAISVLRPARLTIVVASGALCLLMLNMLLDRGTWEDWQTALFRFWTSTNVAALGLFLVGYLALYVQQSRAHAELEAAHLKLQTSAERIEALTRLTERQRLARELHDTLAQGLVGLTLQLETADGLLSWKRPYQAQEIVQQAMARARATLAEAREAINDLRTEPAEELDFVEAVQTEIHHLTTATGISCYTDLELLSAVSPPLQEHVSRIIKEGVTNVVRHAQAQHVWIRFTQEDTLKTIEIRDDGIGFDPGDDVVRQGHYGLVGLQERARLLGGRLEMTSAPGAGTTMRFSLTRSPGGENT